MVRAYVISTVGNSNFASVVLNDISPTKIYYSPNTNEIKDFGNNFHRYLRKCDIYVAVIDSNIINNNFLLLQLRYAKDYAQKHSNKLFIPIILDNSRVPISLDGVDFYTYNTKTKEKSYSGDLPGHTSLNEKLKMLSIKHSQSIQMLWITFAIEIFALAFILLPLNYANHNLSEAMISFITILLFVALMILLTNYYSIMNKKWEDKRKEDSNSYYQRLKEIIVVNDNKGNSKENSTEKDNSHIDALAMMRVNLTAIKDYYEWSQKQARTAFNWAISFCFMGLALVIAACAIQIWTKSDNKIPVLVSIGGIVTEFVSGTIFIIYRYSLSQLNHYHNALHEDERFLSSVNLLSYFSSDEKKDEMLKEIIKGEIEMNLEGTKESSKEDITKTILIKKDTQNDS